MVIQVAVQHSANVIGDLSHCLSFFDCLDFFDPNGDDDFHRVFSSSRNHQVFLISTKNQPTNQPNSSNRKAIQNVNQPTKTNTNCHYQANFSINHQPFTGDGLFYSGPPRSVEELAEMLQRQGVSVKKYIWGEWNKSRSQRGNKSS